MGVFHGRDLFSSKYITAEIKDSSKRLHFVPIKYMIGDYFTTKIDGQRYFFRMDGEICQWRESWTKSFSVVQFDTKHYRPVKSEIKELELTLAANSLPKVNITLSEIFRVLGVKEKTNAFEPHNLEDYVTLIEQYEKSTISKIIPGNQAKFKGLTQNMINFIENLDLDQIVTPMKSISNFIEDDLKATDPQFLGTIATTLQNLDFEDKKVTNAPIGAKKGWMKFILLMMGIALAGFILYWLYSSGAFNQITGPFDAVGNFFKTQSGAGSASSGIPPECQGPPEACKAAVDSGKVKLASLPAELRKVIENFKLPTVTPKTESIDLTP